MGPSVCRMVVRSSTSSGSTSWRCISGAMATGSASSGAPAGTRTTVSSWALPPYPSHQARWKAQWLNGVAQGLAAARASQLIGIHRLERATDGAQHGHPATGAVSPGAGGQGGSPVRFVGDTIARIHPGAGNVARAIWWGQGFLFGSGPIRL